MARPKEKIDPECGRRLRDWINELTMTQKDKERKMTQVAFAKLINMSKEHLNCILQGKKRLTYENAVEIAKKTKNKQGARILPEYLMNQTNVKTTHERREQLMDADAQRIMNSGYEMNGCTHDLIEAAIKNICLDKWESEGLGTNEILEKLIENDFPVLPEDDFMLIKNLVVDYAYSLVYSRINNEKNQPLWLYVRGQRLKEL